jgi:signal transduction histidine kinase
VTLGNRLVVLLSIPLILVMALFGYVIQGRSRRLLHEEFLREGRAVTRVAQEAMEDYLRDRQIVDLRELADQITGFERILGVRIYDAAGQLIHEPAGLVGAEPPRADELNAALRAGKTSESRGRIHGTPAISFMVPLMGTDDTPVGAMQVLQSETFIDDQTAALRRWITVVTLVMTAATALVVIVAARAGIDRPIIELVDRFRVVGAGDYTARPAAPRRDQFGALSDRFEHMVLQLEEARRALVSEQEMRRQAEGNLRQAERLASVGRLAAGVAHEIGTPLNVIGGRAEALQRKLAGHEEAGRSLGIITAQIDRIARIVRGLLDFARGSSHRLADVAPAEVVRRVLELLEHRLVRSSVTVTVEMPADLPHVRADADQLHQVLLNLATNALDALPGPGRLVFRAAPVAALPAGVAAGPTPVPPPPAYVALVVEDTGVGIAPEHLARIFDPFFTTKDVGRGTGLGLAVSYGIVHDHGGAITVDSAPGAGSQFTVYLPAAARLPAAGPGAAPSGVIPPERVPVGGGRPT